MDQTQARQRCGSMMKEREKERNGIQLMTNDSSGWRNKGDRCDEC